MDSDTEDDCAGRSRSRSRSSSISDYTEEKRYLREIGSSRSSTNVGKALIVYDESPKLSTLVVVLEELSKNTEFSTNLQISIKYCMDEFLRLSSFPRVSRRSVIAAAGSILQNCSKIYGDRVEYMYQIIEQQIQSLMAFESKKDGKGDNSNNSDNKGPHEANVKEPRKRRVKQLVQKEFDPFSYEMETKRFRVMSEEKRFSRVGFEKNKNRNRTIEHMYQDHTPAQLWKFAPIVDPQNPFDVDEKRNYKLFTHHPEPRYNTLLPDIPFARLNLVRQFVNANRTSSYPNDNIGNLAEYISLENEMLAKNYGGIAGKKRLADVTILGEEGPKRMRLDELALDNIDNPKQLEESDEQCAKKIKLSPEDDELIADATMENSLKNLTLGESCILELDDSQIETPALSSTQNLNASDSLDLKQSQEPKRMDLTLDILSATKNANENESQIDSGLCLADETNMQHTGQCFDDEGVVIADHMDEQRMSSLSPKVIVQDILPGVPDKDNLTVHVDAEIMSLGGLDKENEIVEELVNVPRDVCYPINKNIFRLPQKKLRRTCMFKLPKEFDVFKQARTKTRPAAEPKRTLGRKLANFAGNETPMHSDLSPDRIAELHELEFDSDYNFKGFRRPTLDSGIDQEDQRTVSANLAADENSNDIEDLKPDVSAINTNPLDQTLPEDVQPVREAAQTENISTAEIAQLEIDPDTTLPELPQLSDVINLKDTVDPPPRRNSILDVTSLAVDPSASFMETDWELAEEQLNSSKETHSIDEETDAKIADWHRRLAPTLEAAHARQNFSIQDLNGEIIAKCQERNGTASLGDVLEDRDPSELCRYMLSALLLTNQGNVKLDFKKDKSKPMQMHELRMQLLSTERKAVNPEDDIGNVRSSRTAAPVKFVEPSRSSTCQVTQSTSIASNFNFEMRSKSVKTTVRLIKPVPKSTRRPDDVDSGISSLASSSSANLFSSPQE